MSREIRLKSFGTFDKRAQGEKQHGISDLTFYGNQYNVSRC